MDEAIEIYNEKNENLNIIKKRSEAHEKGLWHRSAHIWIYNNKSEILLQLRSGNKKISPNMWDVSSAGHIGAGEKPLESAIRELKEEIDIISEQKNLQFYKISKQESTYKNFLDNEFHYVYFLEIKEKIDKLILQKEEVSDIRFYHSEVLKKEIIYNNEIFVPHGDYWFDVINKVESLIK